MDLAALVETLPQVSRRSPDIGEEGTTGDKGPSSASFDDRPAMSDGGDGYSNGNGTCAEDDQNMDCSSHHVAESGPGVANSRGNVSVSRKRTAEGGDQGLSTDPIFHKRSKGKGGMILKGRGGARLKKRAKERSQQQLQQPRYPQQRYQQQLEDGSVDASATNSSASGASGRDDTAGVKSPAVKRPGGGASKKPAVAGKRPSGGRGASGDTEKVGGVTRAEVRKQDGDGVGWW